MSNINLYPVTWGCKDGKRTSEREPREASETSGGVHRDRVAEKEMTDPFPALGMSPDRWTARYFGKRGANDMETAHVSADH